MEIGKIKILIIILFILVLGMLLCNQICKKSCKIKYTENWISTDNTSCRNFPVICPTGSYCNTSGMTGSILCPIGSYCPNVGMTGSIQCPTGTYCPTNGMSAPNECPIGSFCSLTTTLPTKCPTGTYCPNINMTSALVCPIGTYCPNMGMTGALQCPTGTLCQTTGLSNPTDCPPGSFCYYSDSSIQCPAGFYCPITCSMPLTSMEKLTVITTLDSSNSLLPNTSNWEPTNAGGYRLSGSVTLNSDPKKFLIDTGMLTSVKIDASLYNMATSFLSDNWQNYDNKLQIEMYINNSPSGLIFDLNLDGGTKVSKAPIGWSLGETYYKFSPEKKINVELILNKPVFVTSSSYINFVNVNSGSVSNSAVFSNFKITTKTKYFITN